MTTTIIQQVLNEVYRFLDTQTAYVEATLERLDHLRAAVIRRDENALQQMFEQVQQESGRKVQYAQAVQMLRQKLANLLNCPIEEIRLSAISTRLEPQAAREVSMRQAALQTLVRRLTNELTATQALLRECARFNRLLLNSMFGRQHAATYDAHGMSRSNVQGGLMNLRF
ncbi:MAG: hypothetical protein LLF76_11525 [Planctomycetaceae bacterium]|nr:hypothetical protein [Planctomycetaceae bacterium]